MSRILYLNSLLLLRQAQDDGREEETSSPPLGSIRRITGRSEGIQYLYKGRLGKEGSGEVDKMNFPINTPSSYCCGGVDYEY
jgi:hypothetical protein